MRAIVGTIVATLAIVAFMATAAGSATPPCDPCGMDGGTGTELFPNAIVGQDADADGLGDETQDPDGGGLGLDWEDDWFEDHESGDQLDAALGLDVIADKGVLVNTEPQGGSAAPTSDPVLAAQLT